MKGVPNTHGVKRGEVEGTQTAPKVLERHSNYQDTREVGKVVSGRHARPKRKNYVKMPKVGRTYL